MSATNPKFNQRGGKGYKKNKSGRDKTSRRILKFLDVDHGEGYYATVKKFQGCDKVLVTCNDGTEKQVTIPGNMYNRPGQKMRIGFIILVGNDDRIVRIVRDNDKDAGDATRTQGGFGTQGYDIFGQNEEDEDEEDDTTNDIYAKLEKGMAIKKSTGGRSQIGKEKQYSATSDLIADTIANINASTVTKTHTESDTESDAESDAKFDVDANFDKI